MVQRLFSFFYQLKTKKFCFSDSLSNQITWENIPEKFRQVKSTEMGDFLDKLEQFWIDNQVK